ncbi:MAG: M20 family metallo-hydrolase [Siphonobacter sp.]
MINLLETLTSDSIELLKRLIATPSFSREEEQTAYLIEEFFRERNMPFSRLNNNLWSKNKHYNPDLPTVLLNSHHDTVKPNPKWTLDPFNPLVEESKLFGLGSNDAGGCLVSLLAAFCYFYHRTDLKYNIVFAASSEEEVSGKDGMELLWNSGKLGPVDFAIVGEPTLMHLAVAEKGLLVLDCMAQGKAGHAAREEGENALYIALDDIAWVRSYSFAKESPTLGKMKMTATVINTENRQHNVIPATCHFTLDVRVTDQYTLEETYEIIQANMKSEVQARSIRLRPSSIAMEHPIVQAGIALGRKTYGSPTTSDQAVIGCASLKMGPGDSARSHQADEFIYLNEIEEGIKLYVEMLKPVVLT